MASNDVGALYSCEICGEEGLNDEEMKGHMLQMHIKNAISCPFCDLSDICAEKMYIHVNKVHLDYLSPSVEVKDICDTNDTAPNQIANLNSLPRPQMSLNLNNLSPESAQQKLRIPSPAGALGGLAEPDSSITLCPICGFNESSPSKLQEHINRQHFDLTSPTPPFPSLSNGTDENGRFRCPLCAQYFESSRDLELHVNIDHQDILSPPRSAMVTPGDENSNESCPVCGVCGFGSPFHLAKHIDEHFDKKSPSTASLSSSSNTVCSPMSQESDNPTKEMDVGEDEVLPNGVDKAQSTVAEDKKGSDNCETVTNGCQMMDCDGNFQEQSITNMQRAVYSGELSVTDYYTRKVDLRICELNGVDDGHSCLKGLIPKIRNFNINSNNGHKMWLCTTADHYSSTYGDRGWGCGYRNIQMMLSALIHHTRYNHKLFNGKNAIPSISKIQSLIERAWQLGFDPQGCEQLAGKLANTRKWIGATEVVTFFSSFHVRCKLLDCHRPTGPDGTHPDLFAWVLHYFQQKEDFKAPLYLQHQGHSRVIVGVEQTKDGSTRLLIFDPSHSTSQMEQFTNPTSTSSHTNAMRLIRRPLSVMKARQYQVVSVAGIIEDDLEYESCKMLHSIRIPAT